MPSSPYTVSRVARWSQIRPLGEEELPLLERLIDRSSLIAPGDKEAGVDLKSMPAGASSVKDCNHVGLTRGLAHQFPA